VGIKWEQLTVNGNVQKTKKKEARNKRKWKLQSARGADAATALPD
jgi:hypothetical protein